MVACQENGASASSDQFLFNVSDPAGNTASGSFQTRINNPPPERPSADFYGTGQSDILWQNASGEADIWLMSGTTPIVEASLGNPGPPWHLQAG